MALPVRRRRSWVLGLFIVAAIAIAALTTLNGGTPVPVRVRQPAVGRVEEIVTANSVGTVEPEKTAIVAAEVSARILRIRVRQGPAKAGESIFELDARDLEADREVTRREIDTSRARHEQAVLMKKKVLQDLERLKGVDVPKSDIERLERDLEVARKGEDILTMSLRTLEAQLAILDLRLSKTRVLAPFDGTVVRLHSEEGESVIPGKPLFTLHSSGALLVRAPIDEVDMERLSLGLPTRVTIADRGEKLTGVVHEIMPSASTDQKNNRTVDIKIRVTDMPSNVYAGMSANIEVVVRAKDDVLYLPTHLLHDERDSRGKYVFIEAQGLARKQPVRTGLSNWETVEIAEGLGPGARVIVPVQGQEDHKVRDGSRITVIDDAK